MVLYDFDAAPPYEGWSSYSPFVMLVERALRVAGVSFAHERVSFPKIKQINPLGQLPVLRVGEELVRDSTVILHRIEALAPESLTRGLDAGARAEAWLWEEFGDTALYPLVLATRWADERGWAHVRQAFFGSLPAPLRAVIAPIVRRGVMRSLHGRDHLRGGLEALEARVARVLEHLEARAPEAGFWLGAAPSVADLGLFAHLHALRMPATPWRAEEVARRARLAAWLDRVDAATR
ncbi:MAG: glutathione S-transferase family protein [Polyangiales bacterium]